jgi:hypothetical protein
MVTFNKTYSGLIMVSFELPNAPYYQRQTAQKLPSSKTSKVTGLSTIIANGLLLNNVL